jgi:hypothetical protein
MFDSSTPTRSSIATGTPALSLNNQGHPNARIDLNFSSARPSLDEENQLQVMIYNNQNINNCNLPVEHSSNDNIAPTVVTEQSLDKEINIHSSLCTSTVPTKSLCGNTMRPPYDSSNTSTTAPFSSDTGAEISISSVAARRDWLQKFGKQHQAKPFRKQDGASGGSTMPHQSRDDELPDERKDLKTNRDNAIDKRSLPTTMMTKVEQASSKKPLLHTPNKDLKTSVSGARLTSAQSSSISQPDPTHPTVTRQKGDFSVVGSGNLLKNHRMMQREHVKATDEGYASVAELSKWLASDPTSAKKKKHIRRGRNVIMKSRQFEKDQENIIIVENNISRGAVKDKQKWLQTAFKESDEDASPLVSLDRCARSEIAGGTSSYTFNRFRVDRLEMAKYSSNGEAQSQIITDDAASSLSVSEKKDWLKHAFSSGQTKFEPPNAGSNHAKFVYQKAQTEVMYSSCGSSRDEAVSRAKERFRQRSARVLLEKNSTGPATTTVSDHGNKVEKMSNSAVLEKKQCILQDDLGSASGIAVEDVSPVDFRAARNALVERSKLNGHKIQIVNKVYLRTKKYEKLEEDNNRRKTSVHALKPTLDPVNPSKGRKMNSYERHFVSDIVLKKSFDDLP